jgi:hypothetical protein
MSFILNSREMTVQLTREKALTIKKLCQNILLLEYISSKSENAHFIIFINTGGHVLSACAKHVN